MRPTARWIPPAIRSISPFRAPAISRCRRPTAAPRYTRAGTFQLNTDGQIVTLSGDLLLGDGDQPISIPSTTTEINISSDGFVTARVDNGVSLAQLGKIGVFKFDNEQQLQPTGNGLYATDQTPQPADQSSIVQGAIEQSNVQAVTEITQMIQIMRSYEQTVNLIGQENTRIDNALSALSKTDQPKNREI